MVKVKDVPILSMYSRCSLFSVSRSWSSCSIIFASSIRTYSFSFSWYIWASWSSYCCCWDSIAFSWPASTFLKASLIVRSKFLMLIGYLMVDCKWLWSILFSILCHSGEYNFGGFLLATDSASDLLNALGAIFRSFGVINDSEDNGSTWRVPTTLDFSFLLNWFSQTGTVFSAYSGAWFCQWLSTSSISHSLVLRLKWGFWTRAFLTWDVS